MHLVVNKVCRLAFKVPVVISILNKDRCDRVDVVGVTSSDFIAVKISGWFRGDGCVVVLVDMLVGDLKAVVNIEAVVQDRIDRVSAYAEDCPFNRIEMGDTNVGVITSGISYNYVCEAMPDASVLKLGLVFPLPERLICDFVSRCERIIVVEELEPYLEEYVRVLGIPCEGKSKIPRFGEIDTGIVRKALLDVQEEAPQKSTSRLL